MNNKQKGKMNIVEQFKEVQNIFKKSALKFRKISKVYFFIIKTLKFILSHKQKNLMKKQVRFSEEIDIFNKTYYL